MRATRSGLMLVNPTFLSMHDVLGIAEPSDAVWPRLKQTTYDQLTVDELREWERLADLLAQNPRVEELVALYAAAPTLRSRSTEDDPYSALFAGA